MAGAQRYLLIRDGRFFARLAVPETLRAIVGKTILPDLSDMAREQLPFATSLAINDTL